MAEIYRLSLARDFTRHPGPRYIRQGRHSGEEFRSKLLDLLKTYETIEVNLDDTSGIGSSFIDEAFGGLIFHAGMSEAEVRRRVKIVSRQDESYIFEYEDSVSRAKQAEVGTARNRHSN